MNIKEMDLTNDIVFNLKKYFNEFLNIDESSYYKENKKAISLYDDDNNLITIAVIEFPNELNYKYLIEKYMGYNDEEVILEYYNIFKEKVYIEGIKSLITGLNGSDKIIEYIKNKYNGFWFYCAMDTEDFWSTKGYDDVGNYMIMK